MSDLEEAGIQEAIAPFPKFTSKEFEAAGGTAAVAFTVSAIGALATIAPPPEQPASSTLTEPSPAMLRGQIGELRAVRKDLRLHIASPRVRSDTAVFLGADIKHKQKELKQAEAQQPRHIKHHETGLNYLQELGVSAGGSLLLAGAAALISCGVRYRSYRRRKQAVIEEVASNEVESGIQEFELFLRRKRKG